MEYAGREAFTMAIALQTVELRLFGEPALLVEGRAVSFAGFPKLPALLAYLALHEGPVRREQVAFALWPDDMESAARANLRRALHRFHGLVAVNDPLSVSTTALELRREAVSCDVWEFQGVLEAKPAEWISRALTLYRGGLLAHLDDEWIEPFRQRLRDQFCSALASQQDLEAARALLLLDPFREDAIRTVMVAQASSGDRAGALATYRAFAQRLQDEFGVEPDAQTATLHQELARAESVRRTHNLPYEPDPFIGRDFEIDSLAKLYESRRVVTVCGAPGVGKSRLALHYAHETLQSRDETWYVQLAGASNLTELVDTVHSALRVRGEPGESRLEALSRRIAERDVLILADTAEHLLEHAGTLVSQLLANCPQVRILVTSREPLKIAGEGVLRIEPLEPAQARTLLIDRVVAAGGSDAARDSAAIDELCNSLEGIPLALELAAAQTPVLPLSQIAQALRGDPSALTSVRRSGAPHQQTLQDTIAWSYLLLSSEESACLRVLTVFPESWTMAAAAAVCGNSAAGLIEKSFGHPIDARAGRRYALYDSVRSFAVRHTSEEEQAAALRAFCDYYRRQIESLAGDLGGANQSRALEALADEGANIAALLHVADFTEASWGAQLALALYRYWLTRGSYDDARGWLERFARTAPNASLRMRCRAAAAVLSTLLGDVTHADTLLQIQDDGSELDDAARLELHHAAAVLAHERADVKSARSEFNASLHYARCMQDAAKIARALDNLGTEETFLGNMDAAREALSESLAIYRELGNAESTAWVLYHLAGLAFERRAYERVLELLAESMEIRRALDHHYGIALCYEGAAQAKYALGRLDEAKRDYREALTLWIAAKQRSWVAIVLDAQAAIAVREQEYERAGILSEAAARIRTELRVALRPHDLQTHDDYVAQAMQSDATAFQAGREKARLLSEQRCVEIALA